MKREKLLLGFAQQAALPWRAGIYSLLATRTAAVYRIEITTSSAAWHTAEICCLRTAKQRCCKCLLFRRGLRAPPADAVACRRRQQLESSPSAQRRLAAQLAPRLWRFSAERRLHAARRLSAEWRLAVLLRLRHARRPRLQQGRQHISTPATHRAFMVFFER